MATTPQSTLSIGELSRRSGVPVKTIRFYSDKGVLPPAQVTNAGYRRYSEKDAIRLETVRTLRAAGFDIATIMEILDRDVQPDEAMRIQIEAIEVQERTLRRQRRLLERALATGQVAGHPDRGRALALLSSAERSAFLRHQLESSVTGVGIDASWWEGFLAAAVDDIPDDLDDDQLAAWIELVEMTDDPSFADAIRRTATPFWERLIGESGMTLDQWQEHQRAFVDRVRKALRAGVEPISAEGTALIQGWRDSLGPAGDEVLVHMIDTHDPRLAHYWRLVAIIRRVPWDRELDEAWEWILAAARHITGR